MHPGNVVEVLAKRITLVEIPVDLTCAQCKIELRSHDQVSEIVCAKNHFFHVRCLAALDEW